MGWTVIARISLDDDAGGITTDVTNGMKKIGFYSLGTGLWQCLCDTEVDMQAAVDSVADNLSGLGNGVTLDHVILNVFKQ